MRYAIGAGMILLLSTLAAAAGPDGNTSWPVYGGDPGGHRWSPVGDITRENVADLEVAWTFRHGDMSAGRGAWRAPSAFELQPILVDGVLYGCTPMNRVFALEPATGAERWSFDPKLDPSGNYANQLVCRGVAHWRDPAAAEGAPCSRRILTATNDARLIALDAASGEKCAGFGAGGEVDLKAGTVEERWLGEYQVTSAPTLLGDVVIVGSAISDNARVNAPSGVVRAFDVRSGALRWAWDLAPPGYPRPADGSYVLGTPNVWAPMSVDPKRGLVFVPTGNPAPDYYRGAEVPKLDHYGSSVVALRGATGEVVWRFQTVHHDLWDYDVPAQPVLADVPAPGGGRGSVPAVIQATKMGFLFVLHRETGEPVYGVEERPVPQGGVPGETLSPTQPFPVKPAPLVPTQMDEAWGFTFWDRGACQEELDGLRYEGIYTPPSTQGSLMFPGNAGGSNWGSVAVDPTRRWVIANVMNFPWMVRLVPRADVEARGITPGEFAPQEGTPFALERRPLMSPLGVPCNAPPWGSLAAVDLASGAIRWQVPLGSVRDLTPLPIPWTPGIPNIGGPLVTASGLVFIGGALEKRVRAFDIETGEELWSAPVPSSANGTPMTYRLNGRQYVVFAAGGFGNGSPVPVSDALVAFALPR